MRGTPGRACAGCCGAARTSRPTSAPRRIAADGRYTAPFELARSLCLFGAAAAGVPAVDAVYTDFRDVEGLRAEARAAAAAGFSAKAAIHPGQVDAINEAFTP